MQWLTRLRLLLRATLHDLLSEEHEVPTQATVEVQATLQELATRRAAFHAELVAATVRTKQAELDWQAAQAEADTLSLTVDEALRAGQEVVARTQQTRWNAAQTRLTALAERLQANRQLVDQMQDLFQVLQTHEANARHHLTHLLELQRHAEALEQLQLLRRDLRQEMEALQTTLHQQAEAVARLEDRLTIQAQLPPPPHDHPHP